MLEESAARWLLVLHTAIGVAAVGAATHLVLWLRPYRRGQFAKHRAVRRFAVIALVLHALGMLVGNVLYPTYRVEVRAAYLEAPGAVASEIAARQKELDRIAANEHAPSPVQATTPTVLRAGKAVRWFDVKEHWIALGLFASAALTLILRLWHPERDGAAIVPVVFWLSVVVAATLWMAAIIGVMTSAWRAV